MTKLIAALVIFITCVSLLWAHDDRGIGGTGKYSDSDERGMGGTGKYANSDDRGIGGTAVIGTITAFGSIWVNGLEIEFSHDTDIKMDGQNTKGSSLRVGQQVQVLASQKSGTWQAKTILIDHSLVGRLKQNADQTWNIQGVNIMKDPNIPGSWPKLTQDDYVKVSGYFDSNVFYATDIVAANDDNTWKVSAPIVLSKNDKWTIGNNALPADVLDAKSGEIITLAGVYTEYGNRLTRIYYHRDIPFSNQSTHYIVEKRSPQFSESVEYSPSTFRKTIEPQNAIKREQLDTPSRSSFFNEATPQQNDRSNPFEQWSNGGFSPSQGNRDPFGQSPNGTFGDHSPSRSHSGGQPPRGR
ncbi:hypothetical protein EBI01_10180 [Marinomonas rhizomae]|uniref:DUF5666 domain-containing protein n=1 Tax=Marinomonas rhizomae TaxID=491948 RepID=A0A366JBG0_9GAMM|nr:DUF5666 domain-containing protein [Marinomonas rhizomae]RBP83750.1 hypothetical protein DFP80_10570 [Marinomonas rhizomae]RNF73533.1 hypothetical protein EBI01_10180 [Marinomonas rhizomae]